MPELRLSRRVKNIQPSVTLALTARAKALKAEGKDVVALTAGEPDFETPMPIREAAIEALKRGGVVGRYTPVQGLPEVVKAVCEKFKRDNGLEYKPEQVLLSCGAKHSIFNAIGALVDDGDEVILPAPYWVSYPEMIRFFGGKPVVVDTSATGFVLTPEALRKAITPRTRVLIVNSPGNPTGAVWDEATQRALARVVEGTDIAVISDEIYEKLVYEGTHVTFAALSKDALQRTITVNGVAKAYAMTGWRVGYAGGPPEVIKAMNALQSHSTSNPATIAQVATLKALMHDPDELPHWRSKYAARRDRMVAGLNKAAGVKCATPGGAFYVFPDVRAWIGKKHRGTKLTGCTNICEALMTDALVGGVPGCEFGAPGFIRFSYAASDADIEKSLTRIQQFASDLA